ncbi:MAG: DUF1501 domain-containing protein [Pirellulales bacterium]|nr:DUF1501 domain-containing protein [Pirellulales bacterium]
MPRSVNGSNNACSELRSLARANRRQILQVGALGMLGLGLSDWFQRRGAAQDPVITGVNDLAGPSTAAVTANGTFGRAKRCIFLFMWGGPSQLDTFDMKPQAPSDIRGEFLPISTNVPGIQICEHFQHLSRQMDKVCVIRTLAHDDPAHLSSAHATLTGHWAPVVRSDKDPPSEKDSPHLGSVLARLRPGPRTVPSFVTLPWICHHPAAPGGNAPGQDGGWFGKRYSPLLVTGDPNSAGWQAPTLGLVDGISPARLGDRQGLLKELDQFRAGTDQLGILSELSAVQEQAFGLLSSAQVRTAFDLAAESEATRDRYGRNLHGQCVLLARRLVEQGVPLVSVNWHNDGQNFWDTHGNNFARLKNDLIPPSDQALAALLADLDERGLLADTLVCWVGEFGRKPQITAANAGREHWPGCYAGLLAGAGIQGGTTYGTSDNFAMRPLENPVSPLDYAATVLHLLGIDPMTLVNDRLGRPLQLCEGRVVRGVLG